MSSIYKRGRIYYCSYRTPSGRVRESTGCTDKKAAKAFADDAERRAQLGSSPEAHGVTVAVALRRWFDGTTAQLAPTTRKGYELHARHLAQGLGSVLVFQLTRAQVREYLDARTREGAHSHTLQKELVVLRQTLTHAQDAGWTAKTPAEVIPPWQAKYKPKSRWLTIEEVRKVVSTLKPPRALWIWMAVYTGARFGELRRIEWADVDLVQGRIHIKGSKTAKSDRHLAIPAALVAMLLPLQSPGASGPVLSTWDSSSISAAFFRACRRHKLAHFTLHDLRRTYGSWLTQADVGSGTVARLMGHTTTQMVDLVYGHMAQGHLDAAARRLDVAQNQHSPGSGERLSAPEDAREP